MASNIPKFTSFRPKPKEPETSTKDTSHSGEKERSKTSSKEKEKDREREREGRKDKERKGRERVRSRDRHRHRKETEKDGLRDHSRQDKDVQHPAYDAVPSKVFFSDRRGDRDIARYGTMNKYEIPRYRAYAYGHVLGLSLDRKIDRERSTDKEIVITPPQGRQQKRLLADRHALRDHVRTVRFIKMEEKKEDLDADFIALSTRKRKREDDSEDDDGQDYRRLNLKTSAERPLDPDAEYESETVGTVDAEVTRRNATLVRRTREHPEEIEAWLDLVDHQEAMMKIDRSSLELSLSDRQHLADVRISTYEQALKKISDEAGRTRLYAGMMTEATRSWDEGRLTSKWDEVIKMFPLSEELWIQYLNFVQSSFTSFKYESCRSTFVKCLKHVQSGTSRPQSDFVLYMVVRLTLMIQQAGYQELALAMWQALLEFYLFKPAKLSGMAFPDIAKAFEEFWDSECARIGEEGATGWSNSDLVHPTPPTTETEPLETYTAPANLENDFWQRETEHMTKLRYPGRTTDEVGEDDPFHTILFSDIEEYLPLVAQHVSISSLLNAFLCFCQLPPTLQSDANLSRYRLDPFLHSSLANPLWFDTNGTESDTFAQILARYSACPIHNFEMTTYLLFTTAFPRNPPSIVEPNFVRRVLKLLIHANPGEEYLGEYLLAFESQYFPTETHKTAKKLLKARPASLCLYNAYALAEFKNGNSEKADQVFSAALSMQTPGELPFCTPGSLDLFNNWICAALQRKEANQVLLRLVSFTGQIPKETSIPDQASLLRSRTLLRELTDRYLVSKNYEAAVTCTFLSALLIYLPYPNDPTPALTLYNTLSARLTSPSSPSHKAASQLHAQSLTTFLTHHTTQAPIPKPSLLRTNLEPLLKTFPKNTLLLSTYAANEARFAINDRVRDFLRTTLLTPQPQSSIILSSFTLHYEHLRNSTPSSIRSAYHSALDISSSPRSFAGDTSMHCPALWNAYIDFETRSARQMSLLRPSRHRSSKRDRGTRDPWYRVREAFFKGIMRVPWFKGLYMRAFHGGEDGGGDVGSMLSGEEKARVWRVWGEKEGRVYVDVDVDVDVDAEVSVV